MNATLAPPVTIVLPPRTPSARPESDRSAGPRRIGLIMAEVLARHGIDEASAATVTSVPRRRA